jgi:hypothetical protein
MRLVWFRSIDFWFFGFGHGHGHWDGNNGYGLGYGTGVLILRTTLKASEDRSVVGILIHLNTSVYCFMFILTCPIEITR